ncbi:hypothetical protein [Sphingomonas oryzagri]|jgi:hypothetical protein
MSYFNKIATALTGCCMLAIAPAQAHGADIVVVGHPTFRDLEFDYSGADRVAAARSSLDALIPAGTDTAMARAIVRKEGAHCRDAVNDGETRCTFGSFDGVDDHLQDIVWTVKLNSQAGKISDLSVARETFGS